MTMAILNHMPWWAATLSAGAMVAGWLFGAWLTRDDGRRRWWLPR